LYRRYVDPRPNGAAVVAFNIGVTLCIALLAVFWLTVRIRSSRGTDSLAGSDTSHGTARWAPARPLVQPDGLIIGREPGARGALLRYSGDGHLLTLAPTGAGKGVGCVVPNLLTYAGSILVTDPKGENYAVTAHQRRTRGQRVIALDPFGLVGGTGAFNPLDGIDSASPNAVDDAAAVAELLVVREPRESGDTVFWAEEAKALLTGLILHAASSEPRERRSLRTVWEYLSLPPRELTKLWGAMGAS